VIFEYSGKPEGGAGMRLLIVDDEKITRNVLL